MSDALLQRLQRARQQLAATPVPAPRRFGRLVRVTGLTLEVVGCPLALGQRCRVYAADGQTLSAEVVGFNRERLCYLMPLQPMSGLYPGARVEALPS